MKQLADSLRDQFVVFHLAGQSLGLPAVAVKEMLVMPPVTQVPHSADYIRGVIDLRGWVMPLFDLRKRMGMQSVIEEKNALLEIIARSEDEHKDWLNALYASVEKGVSFDLSRDHTRCAFGRWYAGFSTDNHTLRSVLKNMERPHRKIHQVADEVLARAAGGERENALGTLEWARERILGKLLEMFAELRAVIEDTHREIALVLESGGQVLALAVDEVESVETLTVDSMESGRQPWGGGNMLAKVGKRGDGGLVFILDVGDFFMEAEGMRL